MSKNNWFRFKQFTISQEYSAMKVGMDGVLLGAWAEVAHCKSILDIGTGTGVIALMMAQRSAATVVAIDVDELSCREAGENAANSPWPGRIDVKQISFQEFVSSCNSRFDAIISNPPFFDADTRSSGSRRETARHTISLSFDGLMEGVAGLLAPDGKFSVIVPAGNMEKLIVSGKINGLFPERITRVQPNPVKKIHRCLLEFSGKATIPNEEILVIESRVHGDYTEAYKNLTRGFYLAF